MVQRCFRVMDKDRSGVLDTHDLKDLWNASEHPDVVAGKKTEKQVLTEFIVNLEGTSGNKDGRVTMDEFVGQYEELSTSIPNDDYFIEMLCSAYMILETAELTDADKLIVQKSLDRLYKGILDKIHPTMSLETGIRNLFMR